jgi:hypothetical protein
VKAPFLEIILRHIGPFIDNPHSVCVTEGLRANPKSGKWKERMDSSEKEEENRFAAELCTLTSGCKTS